MIDWRNKTTNPQHVGVTVAKGRRSNFDGVWPPESKPAGKPASKPADPAFKNALRQRPMRIGLRSHRRPMTLSGGDVGDGVHLQVATAIDVVGDQGTAA